MLYVANSGGKRGVVLKCQNEGLNQNFIQVMMECVRKKIPKF
jgi:hypothetical protein